MSKLDRPVSPLAEYRAPLIACAIAAFSLALVTLVPGVLGYPEKAAEAAAAAKTATLTAVQEARNQALRKQIAALEGAVEGGMCVADGKFTLPDGEPLPLPAQQALPAAPPSVTEACAEAAESSITVQALADRATVLVARIEGNDIVGTGTGFFIGPGRVLTNAHVVESPEATLRIFSESVGAVDATVVAMGATANEGGVDLALLAAPEAAGRAGVFKFATVERSDRIRAVGYPALIVQRDPSFVQSLVNPQPNQSFKRPVMDSGEVVMKQNEGPTGTWLYHSAYTDSGNSGGPLIDVCGRAVGVHTSALSRIHEGREGEPPPPSKPIARALALETVKAFFRDNGLPPPAVSTVPTPKSGG